MDLKIEVWCQNCGANLNDCTFVKHLVERLELRVGNCMNCIEDANAVGRQIGVADAHKEMCHAEKILRFGDRYVVNRTQAMREMFQRMYGRIKRS